MNENNLNFSELGNYIVLAQINPERQSKTYKVKHKFSEEIFVMKVVVTNNPDEAKTLERTFKRLAQGITKLNNPHIVNFKEYFISDVEEKKCFVLVSEFFPGKELDHYLSDTEKAIDSDTRMGFFKGIASAVADAHKTSFADDYGVQIEGFPHGDITPRNIMMNDKHEIKLLDFKLSTRFTLSATKEAYDKQVGVIPEKVISKSSDIFQLGYLLNYLFAVDNDYGNWNLQDKEIKDIVHNLDSRKARSNKKEIAQIIYKCTRTQPKDRYKSVDELIENIEGKKEKKGVIKILKPKYLAACFAILAFAFSAYFISQNEITPDLSQQEAKSRGVVPTTDKNETGIQGIGDYYALMIGNEKYNNLPPLSKPIGDVNRLEEILLDNYGFKKANIIKKLNASRDDIYDGFEQVVKKVKKNDNLIIFYAGHGQIHDETGYWIPVEGQEKSRRNWISNSEIKNFLNSIVALNVLVVSDACFGGSILRSISTPSSETSHISNKKTRIALTSGSLESVPDHSIFIEQLFWYLENTEDEVVYTSKIFAGIREGIVSNTINDPGYGPIRDSGHQGGDFFFLKQKQTNTME